MTVNNIFVKYPELKNHFSFKKGLFKGFSASFKNKPVAVYLTTESLVDGERTNTICVNTNTNIKQDLISAYYRHCIRILEKCGLYSNAELVDFIRSTERDVWFYYVDKFKISYNFYINKISFDYALMKESFVVTKFVDKYGDVYGVKPYVRKKDARITFMFYRNSIRTTIVLGYSDNLDKVVKRFCEVKLLNEKQKEHLHEWLNKLTIGI